MSSLETPGIDTRLARELLDAGRVDYPTLARLLDEVRQGRGAGRELTLARSLSRGEVLPEAELLSWVERIAGEAARGESWSVGGQIAGLEVLRALGAGGMGAVHLARELQTGAEVAVKTLVLGEDEELGVRFQREAEAQARVGAHSHVVAVHRSGVAGGRAYLVMDVARGGDLATRIREAPLPPRQAAEIARALAAGLEHAHACGILHRDLKPANVLFDERGAPCLTDFGLARLAGAEDLTQTGQVLGTPAFMAPEQACAGIVDERTDVYGLGAILFAALTGRPPFVGSSLLVVLAEVSEGGAPPVRSLRPEVPEALARICERCLAKDPSQRYPSARALEEDLEAFLEGRALAGGRSKAPLGVAALALAALGLLAGALLTRGGERLAESPVATGAPSAPSRLPLVPEPVVVSGDLRGLHEALGRGLTPALAREADAALSESEAPPRWLRERSRAAFFDLSWSEAEGVRDLGQELAVWSSEETRVYDLWTGEVRWSWPGRLIALAPDRTRALLARGPQVRVVELATGAELGSWAVGARIWRARFVSPFEVLIACGEQPQVALRRLELSRAELSPLGVLEGLRDFVVTPRALVFGWWGGSPQAGGLAARRLDQLAGAELWRRGSLGDGGPAVLVLAPGLARVALGTSSGRVQVASCDPAAGEEPRELRLEGVEGIGGAQHEAVDRLGWPSPNLLLVLGAGSLRLWRERSGTWAREPQLELGGLKDFDLGSEGRRFSAVSEGRARRVTQRLLSGYLPELASGAPLFETSKRVRLILDCAEARAGERDDERRRVEHERARAGFSYALESLSLRPALRKRVERALRDLGPRRAYERGESRFAAGRAIAEEVGALDEALTRYLSHLVEDPFLPTNHLRLGRVFGQLGDFEIALRYLEQAEVLAAAHEAEGKNLGGLLERCQRNRERIRELRDRTQARGLRAPR